MAIENEIHEVQAKILTALLFAPGSRFSELNKLGLPNDHFTFHLKKLLELDLVTKSGAKYFLTDRGKEFANRMDTDTSQIERQPKVAVLVVAVRKEKDKEFVLFQKRLKEPYFGYHGFISGKVRWGESVVSAAKRELLEESGLTASKIVFYGVEHKTDIKEGKIKEDKLFFIYKAEIKKNTLVKRFDGGENQWVEKQGVEKIPSKFGDVNSILEIVYTNSKSLLEEKVFKIKDY